MSELDNLKSQTALAFDKIASIEEQLKAEDVDMFTAGGLYRIALLNFGNDKVPASATLRQTERAVELLEKQGYKPVVPADSCGLCWDGSVPRKQPDGIWVHDLQPSFGGGIRTCIDPNRRK